MIFSRKKYRFDPVTLTFEEITVSRWHRIRTIFFFFIGGFSFAMLAGFLLSQVFDSHETRILEKQVASLQNQMKSIWNKGSGIRSSLTQDIFVKDNQYRMILQIDTVSYSYRLSGTGGSALDNGLAVRNDLSYQIDDLIDNLNRQLRNQSGSFHTLYDKALEHSKQQTHVPAILPVSETDLIMVSSDFGVRTDPFNFFKRIHNGLDFVAAPGKKVYATGDGTVTFTKHSRTGYGNEIVIDHKFGFASRYAHLKSITVKDGEPIRRGQVIGTVGETGRATGPHLHYEVLYNHKPVNPAYYFDTSLTNEEYAEILQRASKENN
ncbi:MAG: M23 family metallopeptidase [Bacteroidales bacterium]|nr:M23 family metallopeptidase [Bacteroidales bacterium]